MIRRQMCRERALMHAYMAVTWLTAALAAAIGGLPDESPPFVVMGCCLALYSAARSLTVRGLAPARSPLARGAR